VPDSGVKTSVIFFPFDLFGSSGTGAGVDLLADELREVLADNRRETVATRARAYTEHLRLKQLSLGSLGEYQDWRGRGRDAARKALTGRGRFLWITGNHLGALPVYDELAGRDDVLVVQLDAHLDVHHFADCAREPTHGNFLLHVAGRLPPLVNVGHRELLLTSAYVGRHYRKAISAADLGVDSERSLDAIREAATAADRVFLDIDCDVFDPAFFPAVSQPVPFGLGPAEVLRVIDAAWSDKVAGLLLSEFDPGRDREDRILAILVWLLEYLLLRWYERG
jgi:arginase family enzyme